MTLLFLDADRKYKYPCFFVPALSLIDQQVASLWDKVSLTDLQSDVLSGLQLIHPKISGIAFLGETRVNPSGTPVAGRRVAVVRLSDSSERYPLKSMGDGLSRVLQMILALVSAKDGILLSTNSRMVALDGSTETMAACVSIGEAAECAGIRYNPQSGLRQGFSSVWQDDEDAATFHRLDRDSRNGVKVTTYDHSTLSDSVETEVEVR